MLKTIVFASSLFLITLHDVVAQKTINLSLGYPKINWDYSGNLDGLRTVNTSGWSITASGQKIKENGFIFGIDLGVNRYGNGFQYGIGRPGVGEIHHFSILPLIGYNHIIPGSKFSFRLNFAFGVGIVTLADRYYQNDHSFKVMFTSYGVPLYDLTYSGSQEVKNRIFPLFKPNLELHYALGEKSSLFLKGTLGVSLINPVIVRDFPEVLLDGETYSVTHSTSLSYSSLEIGYSYRIK